MKKAIVALAVLVAVGIGAWFVMRPAQTAPNVTFTTLEDVYKRQVRCWVLPSTTSAIGPLALECAAMPVRSNAAMSSADQRPSPVCGSLVSGGAYQSSIWMMPPARCV